MQPLTTVNRYSDPLLWSPMGDLRAVHLSEMAPMRRDDEEHAARGEGCAGDDRPVALCPKGQDFRRHEPNARNDNEQEPDFSELDTRGGSDGDHEGQP